MLLFPLYRSRTVDPGLDGALVFWPLRRTRTPATVIPPPPTPSDGGGGGWDVVTSDQRQKQNKLFRQQLREDDELVLDIVKMFLEEIQ